MENSFLHYFSKSCETSDAQLDFMRILQRSTLPQLVDLFSAIVEKVDHDDAQASASLAIFIQQLSSAPQSAETYCRAIFFAVVACLQNFDGTEGECNAMLDIVVALRRSAVGPVDSALRELIGTMNLL